MKKAFSLIEIVIAVIIVGVLASFAIPKISSTLERSIISEGITTLQVLHAGMLRYKLEQGSYPAGNDCSLLDRSMAPKYFNNLTCNTASGYVRVDRSNGKYWIKQLENGTFSCTNVTGSLCSLFKFPG